MNALGTSGSQLVHGFLARLYPRPSTNAVVVAYEAMVFAGRPLYQHLGAVAAVWTLAKQPTPPQVNNEK